MQHSSIHLLMLVASRAAIQHPGLAADTILWLSISQNCMARVACLDLRGVTCDIDRERVSLLARRFPRDPKRLAP